MVAHCALERSGPVAGDPHLLGECKAFGQRGRPAAVRGRKIGVAGAHRQAIGLANGGADGDLDRQAEIANHPLHHERLLPVLRPEVGDVGGDGEEQPADDRCHAGEVPWSNLPLEAACGAVDHDPRGPVRRIDALGLGREDPADVSIPQCLRIGLERPRVISVVFVRTELRGVHEDRHGDVVAFGRGPIDEAHVPGMQGPHRRHKPDPPSRGAGGEDFRPHRCRLGDHAGRRGPLPSRASHQSIASTAAVASAIAWPRSLASTVITALGDRGPRPSRQRRRRASRP